MIDSVDAVASFGQRPVQLRQITVGRLSLRVAVWPGNKNRTPLLLLNGIGGNMEMMAPFIDALGEEVEVIMFDMPGTGGSSPPRAMYRMKTLARIAVHVLKKVGHQRADVMGVSWGGALAQQIAHSAPSRCRRLVLCATLAGLPIAWPASLGVLSKMLTPARYFSAETMRRLAGSLYGGRFRSDKNLVRSYIESIKKPTTLGYLMQLLAITGWSSAPWIWRLRQPTLILAGADDPLVPTINAHILARLIPSARLEVLDEGHLFVYSHAPLTAGRVREFLDAEVGHVFTRVPSAG